MLLPLALATLIASAPALRCEAIAPDRARTQGRAPFVAAAMPAADADSTLVALYESGETFEAFLANARARREMWVGNWEHATVPGDVLAQAQALGGRWRLLVAAVDGCSDSVNTVPYIARLVALVPSIELRIVQPGPGRPIMESHRTPDGRAATPTVVLLNELGEDAGCWVERPAALQEMAIKARAEGTLETFGSGKQAWYDQDAGASTLREVVTMIAAAAQGTGSCGAPPARMP